MMAIPTARAHSTPAVLYTKLLGVRYKLLGVRYSSMCQLPVHCVCECVSHNIMVWRKISYLFALSIGEGMTITCEFGTNSDH